MASVSASVTCALTVTDLIALVQVQKIMKRLNFNHTNYGFCKNLTEHMLAGYHNKPFPVCISRPVSVGCIAKGPCPGYVGNTSGATGIILSVACGKQPTAALQDCLLAGHLQPCCLLFGLLCFQSPPVHLPWPLMHSLLAKTWLVLKLCI